MISNQERACIARSLEAKLSAEKARLSGLRKNGMPFDSPMKGFRLTDIKWEKGFGKRMIQIAFLPFGLLLILVICAPMPINYALDLRKAYKKKWRIEKEIKKLEKEPLSFYVSDEKVLESLWLLHGMRRNEYSFDERMNLLTSWIDILYGKEVLEGLKLRSRIDGILEQQKGMRERCGDIFIDFISRVDWLVRDLSKELPPYEDNEPVMESHMRLHTP